MYAKDIKVGDTIMIGDEPIRVEEIRHISYSDTGIVVQINDEYRFGPLSTVLTFPPRYSREELEGLFRTVNWDYVLFNEKHYYEKIDSIIHYSVLKHTHLTSQELMNKLFWSDMKHLEKWGCIMTSVQWYNTPQGFKSDIVARHWMIEQAEALGKSLFVLAANATFTPDELSESMFEILDKHHDTGYAEIFPKGKVKAIDMIEHCPADSFALKEQLLWTALY